MRTQKLFCLCRYEGININLRNLLNGFTILLVVGIFELASVQLSHASTPNLIPDYDNTIIFKIRSFSEYETKLKFYSRANDRVWPASGNYILKDDDIHQYKLKCTSGEKICYGAWDGERTWGKGKSGNNGCANCCWACGESPGVRNLK